MRSRLSHTPVLVLALVPVLVSVLLIIALGFILASRAMDQPGQLPPPSSGGAPSSGRSSPKLLRMYSPGVNLPSDQDGPSFPPIRYNHRPPLGLPRRCVGVKPWRRIDARTVAASSRTHLEMEMATDGEPEGADATNLIAGIDVLADVERS